MKKHLSKIVFGIEIIASLLVLGAVFAWAPVCNGLLTLDSGKMVHMKCFYTGQASIVLALVLLVTAAAALLSKTDHNRLHWVVIAIGVMLVANTFESVIGIGICKMNTMACHSTAAWIRASGILAIAGGIIDIFANRSNTNRLIL